MARSADRIQGAQTADEPQRQSTQDGTVGLTPARARLLSLQRSAGNAATVAYLEQSDEAHEPKDAPEDRPRSPVYDAINRPGTRLDSATRAQMERHLGVDLGAVQLHVDRRSAEAVSAAAYTVGHDVVVHPDHYQPGTAATQRTLAHELTHVVQQRSGPVTGKPAPDGISISDPSDSFEREAEHSAESFLAGRTYRVERTTAAPAPQTNAFGTNLESVQRLEPLVVVQRHSSYEHRFLGDVAPDDLFALGAQYELAATSRNKQNVEIPGKNHERVSVNRDNVTHILDQELRRLRAWQTTEPKLTGMQNIGQAKADFKETVQAAAHEEGDSEWNVQIVAIPSTSGGPPLLVTYGELNTLADFYGNVDELKAADPEKRRNVVQSVRRQSYDELLKIYERVARTDEQRQSLEEHQKFGENNVVRDDPLFNGAFNISGMGGEVGQMMKDKKGGEGSTKYMATLARNACHFAPESWHSWEDYHHKALQLAQRSFVENDGEKKAALLNEALLNNGFGDHYLQDSYAAGHLVNKTKIMQMYVRYLDKHPRWNASYTTDPTWRAFQTMAYKQEGLTDQGQYDKDQVGRRDINGHEVSTAHNPQAVENTQGLKSIDVFSHEEREFNWQDRFQMLGLQLPTGVSKGTDAWKLLVWMQKQRGGMFGNRYSVNFTLETLRRNIDAIGLGAQDLAPAVQTLLDGNIIYNVGETRSQAGGRLEGESIVPTGKFTLRKEWVVSITGDHEDKFNKAVADDADPALYEKMMQATLLRDYDAFMKDAYLQKATNAAHDYFCVQGLQVASNRGESLFKVYGDNNMLQKESSIGVKESAITANMSRDAILSKAETGEEPAGKTTRDILDRLPSYVLPPTKKKRISLAEWHETGGVLETWLGEAVFEDMSGLINAGMGVVSDLGKITKDENVHSGEAF